ncbi:MAG: hypothetical protein JL57_28470, partial [Desulfosporosinus sp. BICA1-9]
IQRPMDSAWLYIIWICFYYGYCREASLSKPHFFIGAIALTLVWGSAYPIAVSKRHSVKGWQPV